MKKIFKQNGDLTLRFSKDAKDQIVKWLDGVDYDFAVSCSKVVNDEVFGESLEFPCLVQNE